MDERQIQRRLASQYGQREKRKKLQALIAEENQGRLWVLDNAETASEEALHRIFDEIAGYFRLENAKGSR